MNTKQATPPIYVISGGNGASGSLLLQTVLAQFEHCDSSIQTMPMVGDAEDAEALVMQAQQDGALIVHTMIDPIVRKALTSSAKHHHVQQVDLFGGLIEALATHLGQEPLNHPGRYYQLNRHYFDRIAAMEYTLAHDDGQRPDGWAEADIILTGVSRTGKTPLSVYLSVLGWKVANIPIVPGWSVSETLAKVDPQRVIGLTIDLDRLLALRLQRYRHIGISANADYINPQAIAQELEDANRACRRAGFHLLDVTQRPIESSANEVLHLLHHEVQAY